MDNKLESNKIVTIIAILLCVILYYLSRLPSIESDELSQMLKRYKFDKYTIATNPISTDNKIAVNPNLSHIASWMSSVGASTAVLDLDNDGLENDLCITEVRNRSVILTPLPTTGVRYEAIELVRPNIEYNADKAFPSGCRVGDFNEDGRDDLLVLFFGRSPLIYLQNNSSDEISRKSFSQFDLDPDAKDDWYSSTATLADLDGDGHIDILVGNYFQEKSEMYDPKSTVKPELHASLSNATNGGTNRFYLWRDASSGQSPHVNYEEVNSNLTDDDIHRWTLAVGAADLNADGLPDLYFANDFGPDTLLINQSTHGNLKFEKAFGSRGFSIPKSKVLGNDSFKGMGIDFADINQDGHFDMFVSNIAGDMTFQESHFLWVSDKDNYSFDDQHAPYQELSEPMGVARSGWAWDTKFGDFDNDGMPEALQATGFVKGKVDRWPELQQWAIGMDDMIKDPAYWPYTVNGDMSGMDSNPFYAFSRQGQYFDISKHLGTGGNWVTRGISITDANGDGSLDMIIANQWEDSIFFKNVAHNKSNQYIGLQLLLPTSENPRASTQVLNGLLGSSEHGYPAIGARVTAKLEDGTTLIGQVDGGNGHSGARGKFIHFGLGDRSSKKPIELTIQWRNTQGKLINKQVTVVPGWSTILLGNA